MKDDFGNPDPAKMRPVEPRNRQIATLGNHVRKYDVANLPTISYASCHEDDLESSLVVARRKIGGQRSVML
ncbi:hypothetical protein [Roseibium sp. SCP14]|uniref:hypothetical protein n=1 Tax=Roseibium sp. SCP14 TaxID=3141375 RepID=UPI0033376A41